MSYILVEYACPLCGRYESLEQRPAPDVHAHPPCGRGAIRVLSAVKFKPQYGAVTRGKNAEPPQHALDTRPMAEGVPLHTWRERSRAKRRAVIRRYGE